MRYERKPVPRQTIGDDTTAGLRPKSTTLVIREYRIIEEAVGYSCPRSRDGKSLALIRGKSVLNLVLIEYQKK